MRISSSQPSISRRDAIRKTVLFSTALLATRWLPKGEAAPAETSFAEPGLNLLAFGDFGSKNSSQRIVAEQMADFARKLNQPLEAVLALGDNFYGKMTPERFERDFEKMYDAGALACPFHACIGNHDYEFASYGRSPELRKYEEQLAYARENPSARWKMPAKWYALELPARGKPLLKLIVLDSNIQEGALTPQEKLAQRRFLEDELAKGTTAPWLWLVWHHPPFTETTKRKDNPALLRTVEQALKEHPFSICLTGHDHNLQHLRVEGFPTSFVISGAGGADGYEVKSSDRGFSEMILGFNHFHLTPQRIRAQFIDSRGGCVHAFERYPDGRVKILT